MNLIFLIIISFYVFFSNPVLASDDKFLISPINILNLLEKNSSKVSQVQFTIYNRSDIPDVLLKIIVSAKLFYPAKLYKKIVKNKNYIELIPLNGIIIPPHTTVSFPQDYSVVLPYKQSDNYQDIFRDKYKHKIKLLFFNRGILSGKENKDIDK